MNYAQYNIYIQPWWSGIGGGDVRVCACACACGGGGSVQRMGSACVVFCLGPCNLFRPRGRWFRHTGGVGKRQPQNNPNQPPSLFSQPLQAFPEDVLEVCRAASPCCGISRPHSRWYAAHANEPVRHVPWRSTLGIENIALASYFPFSNSHVIVYLSFFQRTATLYAWCQFLALFLILTGKNDKWSIKSSAVWVPRWW